jgi:hypothetical protein
VLLQRQSGPREGVDVRRQPRMTLDVEPTLRALVEDPTTSVEHIERNHPRHHDLIPQPVAQDLAVADAILEADHDRARLQYVGQFASRTRGPCGLHRHQHQISLRSRDRRGLVPDVLDPQVGTDVVRQPQPVLSQFIGHSLPPDERHWSPGRR